MAPPQVVCLGETMAQLAPLGGAPVEHADTFQLTAAGAESNVAVGLSQLGHDAAWAGRVGDDALGRRLVRQLAEVGVRVDLVAVDRDRRTGFFVKSPGRDGSAVTYYRDGSAGSAIDVDDVERSLSGRPRLLHLSGVTPALSASCLHASRYAVEAGGGSGALVSFDVNHRPVLWPDPAVAARVLLELASASAVVFVGLDEARALWPGVRRAADVRALLPAVRHVVVKDGAREATGYDGATATVVPAPRAEVVEPVGAGDAFAAGWLHGWLRGDPAGVRLRLGHLMAQRALASVADYPGGSVPLEALHAEASRTSDLRVPGGEAG